MATNNFITTGLASATGTAPPGALTKTDNPTAAAVPTTYRWGAADIQPTLGALADISTYLNNIIDLQSYGADPTGTADCSTALTNACTAAGSGNGAVRIRAGVFKLTSNVLVPRGVVLLFEGGSFSIANGVTLTVAGEISAPKSAQIFTYNASPSAEPVLYQGTGAVSVKWWGAKGDGSTDDTAAIQRCFRDIQGQELSSTSATAEGSIRIFFPGGIYCVSTAIQLPGACLIQGEGSIIKGTSSSNDIFVTTSVAIGSTARGGLDDITLVGGQNGLNITGSDVTEDSWYLNRVVFIDQALACLRADRDSCAVQCHHCEFYNGNTASGSTLVYADNDFMSFTDCSFAPGCPNAFTIVACNFEVVRAFGISTTAGYWFNSTGPNTITCYSSRLGGENGGRSLLSWTGSTNDYQNPNVSFPGQLGGAFTCRDTNCFSAGQFIMNFQDLPAVLNLSGNQGFGDSNGIHFDTAIPLSARASLGYGYYPDLAALPNFTNGVAYNGIGVDSTSDQEIVDRVFYPTGNRDSDLILPKTADLQGIWLADTSGVANSTDNVTTTHTTNIFGTYVDSILGGTGGGAYSNAWNQALGALSAGYYTAIFDIDVQGGFSVCQLQAGESQVNLQLPRGHHEVAVPFYWNAAKVSPTAWAAGTYYAVGAVVASGAGGTAAPYAAWQCIQAGTSAGSGGPGSAGGSDAAGIQKDGAIATTVATTTTMTTGSFVLPLTSAASFPTPGSGGAPSTCYVTIATAPNDTADLSVIAYTGKSGNSLTGCTYAQGPLVATSGTAVYGSVVWAWIGNQTLSFLTNVPGGSTVVAGPIRVLAGRPTVRTENTIVRGSAAPGSGAWEIGDQVVNTAPAAGGVAGWICTTAGSPGTWKAFGQISA